jgi:hypothetical protein
MSFCQNKPASAQIYARWRPLLPVGEHVKISHLVIPTRGYFSISITGPSNVARLQTWKSGASFIQTFTRNASNQDVFRTIVEPKISRVLSGETGNLFDHGHTGSGKTHTIGGYNYDNDTKLGLVLAAARELFTRLESYGGGVAATAEETEHRLRLYVRLCEVRGNTAHDLLNSGMESHVREGTDGQIHIRGPTEILEDGKVQVCPVASKACWSFTQIRDFILGGFSLRKTGASEVHDESSRTHAIFELEMIDQRLRDLREAAIQRESKPVPVGKKANDFYLEQQLKTFVRSEHGQYSQNPDHPLNQARIDETEAKKKTYKDRLRVQKSRSHVTSNHRMAAA